MSKISIALCAYNGAKFLPAQLESFLTQTRLPDELVIGDDCSKDETVAIIKDFIKKAPFPVKLKINEKNLGSTGNFEQTIKRCTGDLIFLSDQDDVWLPEKLEKIEAEFTKNLSAGLIFSNAELVSENLHPLGKNLWDFTFSEKAEKKAQAGEFFKVLLWQNAVTGATMAFRTEFQEDFLPIPAGVPNLIHDAWIALAFAAKGKINLIDESLIKYRQHSGQQLGLNLEHQEKTDFESRKKNYSESIKFLENEIERLKQITGVLEKYSIFSNKIELVNNLVPRFIEEKRQIINHYETRKNIPAKHRKRIIPVAKEILSGRYSRFSRGFLSAAKDLLER